MIHAGLPAPALLRLRLRAQLAAVGFRRVAQQIRQGVLTTITTELTILRSVSPSKDSLEDEVMIDPVMLQEFAARHRQLVNLLCAAARDQITSSREKEYSDLRRWMRDHYDHLRPILIPRDSTPAFKQEPDTFEILFLAEKLYTQINSDTIIYNIMRSRAILEDRLEG